MKDTVVKGRTKESTEAAAMAMARFLQRHTSTGAFTASDSATGSCDERLATADMALRVAVVAAAADISSVEGEGESKEQSSRRESGALPHCLDVVLTHARIERSASEGIALTVHWHVRHSPGDADGSPRAHTVHGTSASLVRSGGALPVPLVSLLQAGAEVQWHLCGHTLSGAGRSKCVELFLTALHPASLYLGQEAGSGGPTAAADYFGYRPASRPNTGSKPSNRLADAATSSIEPLTATAFRALLTLDVHVVGDAADGATLHAAHTGWVRLSQPTPETHRATFSSTHLLRPPNAADIRALLRSQPLAVVSTERCHQPPMRTPPRPHTAVLPSSPVRAAKALRQNRPSWDNTRPAPNTHVWEQVSGTTSSPSHNGPANDVHEGQGPAEGSITARFRLLQVRECALPAYSHIVLQLVVVGVWEFHEEVVSIAVVGGVATRTTSHRSASDLAVVGLTLIKKVEPVVAMPDGSAVAHSSTRVTVLMNTVPHDLWQHVHSALLGTIMVDAPEPPTQVSPLEDSVAAASAAAQRMPAHKESLLRQAALFVQHERLFQHGAASQAPKLGYCLQVRPASRGNPQFLRQDRPKNPLSSEPSQLHSGVVAAVSTSAIEHFSPNPFTKPRASASGVEDESVEDSPFETAASANVVGAVFDLGSERLFVVVRVRASEHTSSAAAFLVFSIDTRATPSTLAAASRNNRLHFQSEFVGYWYDVSSGPPHPVTPEAAGTSGTGAEEGASEGAGEGAEGGDRAKDAVTFAVVGPGMAVFGGCPAVSGAVHLEELYAASPPMIIVPTSSGCSAALLPDTTPKAAPATYPAAQAGPTLWSSRSEAQRQRTEGIANRNQRLRLFSMTFSPHAFAPIAASRAHTPHRGRRQVSARASSSQRPRTTSHRESVIDHLSVIQRDDTAQTPSPMREKQQRQAQTVSSSAMEVVAADGEPSPAAHTRALTKVLADEFLRCLREEDKMVAWKSVLHAHVRMLTCEVAPGDDIDLSATAATMTTHTSADGEASPFGEVYTHTHRSKQEVRKALAAFGELDDRHGRLCEYRELVMDALLSRLEVVGGVGAFSAPEASAVAMSSARATSRVPATAGGDGDLWFGREYSRKQRTIAAAESLLAIAAAVEQEEEQ